jgi:AraC family transcriptional regulator
MLTIKRYGRPGRKLHMTLQNFEQLVPRTALHEVMTSIHGPSVEHAALPPMIVIDGPLLALLRSIKKVARELPGETTLKPLIKAAAAHVVETQVAVGLPLPSCVPDSAPLPPTAFPRLSEAQLRQIEDYVQSALSGPIQVGALAQCIGMSHPQFTSRFQATTGMSPQQFIIKARIDTAKTMLAEGSLSLAKISAHTGFSSPSHFSATFRRVAKMLPTAYRAQTLGAALTAVSMPAQNPSILPGRLPVTLARAPAADSAAEHPGEFLLEQSSLPLSKNLRLLQSSQGRGWTNLFVALTDETPHAALFGAVPAVWIAATTSDSAVLRYSTSGRHHHPMAGCTISIVAAGEAVYDELTVPLRAHHFYLRQQVIDEAAQEMFRNGHERRFIRSWLGYDDFALYRLLTAICVCLNEPAFGSRLKVDCLTQALAVYLLTKHSVVSEPPVLQAQVFNARQLQRLRDYIDANLASDIGIDDLCPVVGLKRTKFIECFKATASMTPYQFVMLRRISQARKLLARSRADQEWIAMTCGFGSQSHFIATFRRMVGMTPGIYRRSVG